MTDIDINSTSLQGQITANYADLVTAFGTPLAGDAYKTDAEWHLRSDTGTIASVYNWKNGPAYCGSDGTPVAQITRWNIGGRSHEAVELVERLLGRIV